MTDAELLHRFSTTQAQDAFRQLVSRYVNLVHASARRQLRDSHLADDVTQAVFILLAQKAGSVRPQHLPGWLLSVTRSCAKNALRLQLRRSHHEQQAAAMRSAIHAEKREVEFEEIAPFLDDALRSLSALDRSAVALRFLQNNSLADVGAALDMSENAVQKRLTRALDRLRKMLSAKGIALTAPTALASVLLAAASHSAPSALAATICTSAFATAAAGTTAGLTPGLIAKGAAGIMFGAKAKIAVVLVAIVLLLGTTALLLDNGSSAPPSVVGPTTVFAEVDAPAGPDWPLRFEVVAVNEALDQAASLAQIREALRRGEDSIGNLRVESTYQVQHKDEQGDWVYWGEGQRIIWFDGKPGGRFHVRVDREITPWSGGAAPFAEDQYTKIWDGQRMHSLFTKAGVPGAGPARAARTSMGTGRFLPPGTGWECSLFGFLEYLQDNPRSVFHDRFSDYFDPAARFVPKLDRVTLNGETMIRAVLNGPVFGELYLDPAHGYAIRGWERPGGGGSTDRYLVAALLKTDTGLYYPGRIARQFSNATRMLIQINSAAANIQDLPADFFTMYWDGDMPVWDEDAHKVVYPGRAPSSTLPAQ